MRNKYSLIELCLLELLIIFSLGFSPLTGYTDERIRMATTTSVDNCGLLDVLLPPFEKKFGIKVDVIAVGTGKALKLGENGDVDIVFVHSRQAEDEFINNGYGLNRRDVMHNDFLIVGPKEDPAGIKGLDDVIEALKRIAKEKSPFVSRGDDSGTHKKELALWKEAGLEPQTIYQSGTRQGAWYMQAGQGMGATLMIADQKRGYTLSDRATFITYKKKINLVPLCEGDERLHNPYGIIAVNPARHPSVNYVYAMALIGWMTSQEGQKIIREYKIDGEQLFFPDAIK